MKACVRPLRSIWRGALSWPLTSGAPVRFGHQGSNHFRRPLETEAAVHGFSKRRCVQRHPRDSAVSCPLHRGIDDPSRVAHPALVGLGEHREEVRDDGPLLGRPRLNFHEPNASARNGPLCDLDDESHEPTRTDSRPRPSAIHSIRGIEFQGCVLVNRREHRTPMTDEEVEIPDRRQAHPRSDHAVQTAFAVNGFASCNQP